MDRQTKVTGKLMPIQRPAVETARFWQWAAPGIKTFKNKNPTKNELTDNSDWYKIKITSEMVERPEYENPKNRKRQATELFVSGSSI
jgi:hypothetical protein